MTNAAKQENSRKSLTTLAMMPPMLRHGQWLAPTPSAFPYRDQNMAAPARIDDYGGPFRIQEEISQPNTS